MKTLLFPGLLNIQSYNLNYQDYLVIFIFENILSNIFSLRNWSLDPSSRKWSRDDTALINKRKR